MSAYAEFFIKIGERFAPIGSFSRSSVVYQIVKDGLPWEKARPLNKDSLRVFNSDLEVMKQNYNTRIWRFNELIEFVKSTNDPLSEKVDIVEEYKDQIEEIKVDLKAIEKSEKFFWMLEQLLGEANDTQYDEEQFRIDSTHYIYAGIECGINPEITD